MKNIVCIVCPNGCRLTANDDGTNVQGQGCKRGEAFALQELTRPMRSLTTTVKTAFENAPVLPVRTDGEMPKGMLPKAIKELSQIVVSTPLVCGDIVVENLLGTGCNVIATSSILCGQEERKISHVTSV
ncbi:MAG: DUF1667 domain-containing protein [Oscillospiraceae bacterium]